MEDHKGGKGIYLFVERYTAFCQEVGLGKREWGAREREGDNIKERE